MESIIIVAAKKVLINPAVRMVIKAITKEVCPGPYNKYPIEDSINQEKGEKLWKRI